MAETLPELKTGKASKKTGNTTKNRKRKRASGGKASSKDGVELLRQAVNKRLVRDSEVLADAISEKARNGDLASTKTMVGLAAGKKPLPDLEKTRSAMRFVQRLANEPQWQGKEEEEEEV